VISKKANQIVKNQRAPDYQSAVYASKLLILLDDWSRPTPPAPTADTRHSSEA
jgi:hypothetical protein